jgi:tetratricopeptide (TPR) repeat protein
MKNKAAAIGGSRGIGKLKTAAEAGKSGNYGRAVKILRELVSETDAPPEAWLLLGRSLHALKDYSHALAAFNDYIRQRPEAGEGYLFAGRSYLTVGMPYKAVPFLRKALENSPGDSKTKALLGTAYLKSKHSQAAVDILQEAVEAAPADKRIYRAYINALLVRGIRLCGIGDYDLGFQMLRFVLDNGAGAGMADNPFLRLELGRAARETGKLEEALEHFTAALNLTRKGGGGFAGDRRIRWSRASILMALGRNAEAVNEIEKIRGQDAGVPELPWNSELVNLFMIRSFMETGEWKRAAASCRDWLRTRDDKPMIRALCAEALRNLRNYKAAHNHLLLAIEAAPNELEFRYADMLVSWEGKDYKSLKRAIGAAKSLNGDTGITGKFSVLWRVKTSDDTRGNIALLQNAIRSMGPEPELMYALGEAYLKAGLLEEARSWFGKTVSLMDGHESARLGEIAALEAIFNSRDDPAAGKSGGEELGSLYKAYLERWPDNSAIRRERALFLIKTFEYAEAAGELEKLLVWEPSNPSLRRVLAYAYRKTGRYREAAVFLKALLREKPKDTGLLLEYSGCLERTGAAHYATAILEKAKELFGTSARKEEISGIALALGILRFRRRDVEKALDCFREAAALNTGDPRPYEWMAYIAKKNGDTEGLNYYENEARKRK